MLPYLHSLAAGMKAWATQEASDGAEDARKCCGGHGLLMMSGVPDIAASITAAATFEGDNYVLWQQVGRFLVKLVDALKSGKWLQPQMSYLSEMHEHREESLMCSAQNDQFLERIVQLTVCRHRAQRLVFPVHAALRLSSKAPAEAWNEHMMAIISAGQAHLQYTGLQAFVTQLDSLPHTTTPALRLSLNQLRSLFALSNIIDPRTVNAMSFFEDGYLSSAQPNAIRRLVKGLLDNILSDAIVLTDAWDFNDASLCSALGMADGNVYENLMRWVEQLPINQRALKENVGVFRPARSDSVEPILKAKM